MMPQAPVQAQGKLILERSWPSTLALGKWDREATSFASDGGVKYRNRNRSQRSSLVCHVLSVFVSALLSPFLVRKAEKLESESPGFKSQLFFFQAVASAASGGTSGSCFVSCWVVGRIKGA